MSGRGLGVTEDTDGGMECLACDLASGRRPLPGGLIHETGACRVEHCVGRLGVGTLVVKPKRHVLNPEQVYVCLWSHADGAPVHIHYVVQPVTRETIERHGARGPRLQAAMFESAPLPSVQAVEAFAVAARRAFESS
jgi:hypothetical protein